MVFAKQGDSTHVKNKVAHIIKGLEYSKIVIKSDQELTIRAMEMKVAENVFEGDFELMRGCEVAIQVSPVGGSAANGTIENAMQRAQGQVRAIKLDPGTNVMARLNPSQAIRHFVLVDL